MAYIDWRVRIKRFSRDDQVCHNFIFNHHRSLISGGSSVCGEFAVVVIPNTKQQHVDYAS